MLQERLALKQNTGIQRTQSNSCQVPACLLVIHVYIAGTQFGHLSVQSLTLNSGLGLVTRNSRVSEMYSNSNGGVPEQSLRRFV